MQRKRPTRRRPHDEFPGDPDIEQPLIFGTMKPRITTIAALALLTIGGLQAQTTVKPVQTGTTQTLGTDQDNETARELGITEDQLSRMRENERKYGNAMRELQNTRAEADVKTARAKELHNAYEQETKAILTPEQYTKLMETRKEKRADAVKAREEKLKQHNE